MARKDPFTPPIVYGNLIQYFGRNPPYLEAVSSTRNVRMRHAVVIRDPLNLNINLPKISSSAKEFIS
jgi:hypothetical protein